VVLGLARAALGRSLLPADRLRRKLMFRRIATTVATAAAVAAGIAVAGPASPAAADAFYRWGETTHYLYQYGNPRMGEIRVEAWVDDWDDDIDGDGLPDRELIRGHARVCKVSKALRTQVDLVRLGNYTQGGVLAENPTDRNSGTATCAESVTGWVQVTWNDQCLNPFEAWVRNSWSVRWANTGRLSKGSFLSHPTGWDWCPAGAGAARTQR
jgi:hypothetical protein